MKFLIDKPHLVFFLAIPILILIGVLSGYDATNKTLDFNFHDTYFVVAHFHLIAIICILFGIIGLGYWIMQKTNKVLSKLLNLIHVGLTFGGTLVVWILTQFYQTEIMEYEFNNNLNLSLIHI